MHNARTGWFGKFRNRLDRVATEGRGLSRQGLVILVGCIFLIASLIRPPGSSQSGIYAFIPYLLVFLIFLVVSLILVGQRPRVLMGSEELAPASKWRALGCAAILFAAPFYFGPLFKSIGSPLGPFQFSLFVMTPILALSLWKDSYVGIVVALLGGGFLSWMGVDWRTGVTALFLIVGTVLVAAGWIMVRRSVQRSC